MIPKSCHHLPEVDFPIAEVSRHAIRAKSISARTSEHTALVVAAAAVGFVSSGADGAAAARPVRGTLSGGV